MAMRSTTFTCISNSTWTKEPAMLRISSSFVVSCLLAAALADPAVAAPSVADVVAATQPKMVKIYGAGGVRGLEPYQSGFLISAHGHVLTAFSYVLDTDTVKVTLNDGRRFEGTLVGADPRLEIAVLKIDATDLPHFDLAKSPPVDAGSLVLALSNLFGVATGEEPVSAQRGVIMAETNLDARRGTFDSTYRGPVYVVDAVTNNPGAAGGALINCRGELLGLLGKELRNARNGAWLNYAIPIGELSASVDAILKGTTRPKTATDKLAPEEAHNLAALGVTLVPNVLDHTPPYVDDVRPGSPAATAGLQRDDLIILIGEVVVNSCGAVNEQLASRERSAPLPLIVKRGSQLVEVLLPASP
jgi:serine protease Do